MGATPTFKGYGGFPGSICASVNEQIVHGIPSSQVVLKDGDILSIDTGATYKGWVGDNAWTFYVGNPSDAYKGLCECTRDCLKAAIEQAVPETVLATSALPSRSLPSPTVMASSATTLATALAM